MENRDTADNGFSLILKHRYVIMGIAAIWIHVFHVYIPVFHSPTNGLTLFLGNIEEFIRRMGYCGVEVFLLISGMGLTYAIKKGSVATFYKRRLRRIFLPYLLITLIRWAIDKWTVLTFLENITGFSFYAENIHFFCWFIPAIASIYLVFPLYYKIFSKAKNKLLFTALSILLWFLLTFLAGGFLRYDIYEFTNRIPIFLIGIYFGELSQDKNKSKFTIKHYLLLLAAFVSGVILAYLYNYTDFILLIPNGKTFVPNVLISLSLSFLVAIIMDKLDQHLPKLGRIINGIISFWGKMSLEVYCAYICFLIPYFLIVVRFLGSLKLPIFVINIVVFLIASCIAFLISLVCNSIIKFIERPKKN